MTGPRNRVVQLGRFGDPDELKVVDATLPTADRGEVRVRALASALVYERLLMRLRHANFPVKPAISLGPSLVLWTF